MKMQQDPKSISKLIVKFLRDELSGQEAADFKLWLDADQKNQALLESFRNTTTIQKDINYLNSVDVNEGWTKLAKNIDVKTASKFNFPAIIRYSAAAILFITLGFGVYSYTHQKQAQNMLVKNQQDYDVMPGRLTALLTTADGATVDLGKTTKDFALATKDGFLVYKNYKNQNGASSLTTPKAGEYKMILPDGTKVFLNSASTLKFSSSFNQNERRVQLSGEAYFEVAHNKNLPFVVSFNNTEVEVLGTHFNISSYKENSKTTLLEGAIKIRTAGKQSILKPGDEADISDGVLNIKEVDTYKSIAWKEGMFYFHEDSMTDILDQVSRWYDVKIEYNGTPGTKKYSGDIRRQATLNQVLAMLNAVSGANFTLQDRTVTVNF